MESSIAEFLMRWSTCELLPTSDPVCHYYLAMASHVCAEKRQRSLHVQQSRKQFGTALEGLQNRRRGPRFERTNFWH